MRTYDFSNERRMQRMFGLRYRPDRFTRKATAESFARGCTKPHYVVFVDENPDGIIEGWYVVCPADAERLHRETEGLITYAT